MKLKLIESISTVSLEKRFYIEDFFNQFSIPNKKLIIDLYYELKDWKLIEPKFKLINKNGSTTKVKQLTPLLLSKSKDICFCETINFRV